MYVDSNQVEEWKQEYGDVYEVVINEQRYIYRSLNIGECEKIQSFYSNDEAVKAEEFVLSRALLYPDISSLDNQPAGIAKNLSENIIISAGVFLKEDLDKLLTRSKEWVEETFETDFLQWKISIMQSFPGYKLSDLDEMDPYEFFKLVRLCEKVHEVDLVRETPQPKNDPRDQGDQPIRNSSSSVMSGNDFKKIAADESAKKLKEEYLKAKNSHG